MGELRVELRVELRQDVRQRESCAANCARVARRGVPVARPFQLVVDVQHALPRVEEPVAGGARGEEEGEEGGPGPRRVPSYSSVILRSTLVHTTFCQNSLPRGSTLLYQYASVVDLG